MFLGHLICLFASASIAAAAVAVPENAGQYKAADAITATGKMQSISETAFFAKFAVGGITHTFLGRYTNDVPDWNSSNAILTFNNESQLVGKQTLKGTIGHIDANLQLQDDSGSKLSMFGHLDSASPFTLLVEGSGEWIH